MGIRIEKTCNLSMLNFIEKFGPVEIDDLYSKFGNGIKSIVDEDVKNLLDNAKIMTRTGQYNLLTNHRILMVGIFMLKNRRKDEKEECGGIALNDG